MSGYKLNLQDLIFVLRQIKIAEGNAAGVLLTEIWVDDAGNIVPAGTPGATLALPTSLAPFGLRTVDGRLNNVTPGREVWGAADQAMPRLFSAYFHNDSDGDVFDANGPAPGGLVTNTNYASSGSVADADPRIISNLIADQSINNPAAISAWLANPVALAAWQSAHPGMTPVAPGHVTDLSRQLEITSEDLANLPNISPDIGLSPSFNAWMTFFGQFFDHGLDLVAKGKNGTVYVPLRADDLLMTVGPDGISGTGDELSLYPEMAFMVLTRAAPVDGAEARNLTTPYIDQNQTYTSHPSHQVFLREYKFDSNGQPVATGKLLDGGSGDGLPTWSEVKLQALHMLGIALDDRDVASVPLLRTDAYGRFIPDPDTGFAQVIIGVGEDGIPNTSDDITVSGTPDRPIITWTVGAIRTTHAFLDDIAHNAAPVLINGVLAPDADFATGNSVSTNRYTGQKLEYDNELLDRHFVTGDGRGNENIGLTAVHQIFHSEHNRQAAQQQLTLLQGGNLAFLNEWLKADITQAKLDITKGMTALQLTAFAQTLDWDGERLFQAARYATEMQYQHLVFEEFARKIQPNIDVFAAYSPDVNPAIFAEFAHVVYRFGHSMLGDDMPRIDEQGSAIDVDVGLIDAFLNPVLFDHEGTMSEDEATASVVRGMTVSTGSEIDEFVVGALRNNLLGLPLDLVALNISRGRDAGVPTLNEARAELYAATGVINVKPYVSWVDFASHLKTSASVVNFIAAYGRHPSVLAAPTLEEKRDAAMLLVFGNMDVNSDGIKDLAPADRLQFLMSTGAWSAANNGLNDIDFWIGGLAEEIMPFNGMLGSTFNAVFELQLENLQNGDRFYYLSRLAGQNMLTAIEQNAFSKIILANSNLTDVGPDGIRGTPDDIVNRHIGIDAFLKYDYVLEIAPENQADYDPENVSVTGVDPIGGDLLMEALGLGMVARGDHYLRFSGEDHVVLGGSSGNDTLYGGNGIDALWGDDGDDRLDAGMEVDLVNGGGGNDVITDAGGGDGDFLKGEEGDDVIANGSGLDIIIGGSGRDALFLGVDGVEVFAGENDDFILGGAGADVIQGNEGDDWIEGGGGADDTAGDNGGVIFGGDIIGHDVMFAGKGDHGHDGESGDDILVQGEGVVANQGLFGFDWATYQGVQKGAVADLGIPVFTPPLPVDVLRVNRFTQVEALSGWNFDDLLVGDDRVYKPTVGGGGGGGGNAGAGDFIRDELDLEGIARIEGLNKIVTSNLLVTDDYGADFKNTVQQIFASGNVLLGGGGSDVLSGKAGDDIIDGDAYLNVRLRITAPGADNIAANEIATIDSLQTVFSKDYSIAAWRGKSVFELMADRVIVPSQLHIVREILDGNSPGDVDTAVFWDIVSNYAFSENADGSITISHFGFNKNAFQPQGFKFSDGTDTIRNIERLRFGDGAGGWVDYDIAQLVHFAATGIPVINDATPLEGQTLSVNASSIADRNGIISDLMFQWQKSADGTNWTDIVGATNAEFSLPDPPGASLSALAGLSMRVVVSFIDGMLDFEQIASAATGKVGINYTALGSGIGVNFTGGAGDDVIRGSAHADTLNGGAGNDALSADGGADALNGNDGDDILTGGGGNDILDGGAGTDCAVFEGVVANYAFSLSGGALIVRDVVAIGGLDTVRNVERFRFSNGSGGTVEYTLAQLEQLPASGTPVVSDTTPLQGQTLTVSTSEITDFNGLGAFSFQWQRSANGTSWTNIAGATGSSFKLPDAPDTNLGLYLANQLRVVVSYTDGLGHAESVTSEATGQIGLNYSAGASAAGVNISGRAGDDYIVGSNFADRLLGMAGNDTLVGGGAADEFFGGDGNDIMLGSLAANDGNDVFNGGVGDDVMFGGAGDDTLGGGGGVDRADFTGPVGNYLFSIAGQDNAMVTDAVGNEGKDSVRNVEVLRFAGVDYTIVMDVSGGANASVNGPAGQAGSQVIFGLGGADTLFGGGGSDILVGGFGDDTVFGGDGDDFIYQRTDETGYAVVDGGDGIDTYILAGNADVETFRIYTRAEALAAGINSIAANTEIVIMRNGTNNASIIAQLDNIEEIKINSHSVANTGNIGDSVIVVGDFNQTSLHFNTIRVEGTDGSDTIDITGLTSAHRVVFESNGGGDTIVGQVRSQDIFNGVGINDQRVTDTASLLPDFGMPDGVGSLISGRAETATLVDFTLSRSMFAPAALSADAIIAILQPGPDVAADHATVAFSPFEFAHLPAHPLSDFHGQLTLDSELQHLFAARAELVS